MGKNKTIGTIIQLDPAKEYIMLVDHTEVTYAQAKQMSEVLKSGRLATFVLPNLGSLRFVEKDRIIEIKLDSDVLD